MGAPPNVMNKLFRYHPRVWISFAAGAAIFFLLPHWSIIRRILVCWNCGVVLFLGLIYSWMTGLSAERICSRYIEEDEYAHFILAAVVIAALLSGGAICELLGTVRQVAGAARLAQIT